MRPALRVSPRLLIAMAAFLFLATSCGGEGRGKKPVLEPTGCPDLRLEVVEAKPLQLVRVEGIPSRFGELLAAHVTSPAGAESVTLVARQDDDSDTILLYAPIHPEALLEGGEVSLQIVDDADRACEPITFRILPMAAAPGTTVVVKERIGALLEGVAEYFGTSVEELRAAQMEDVPEHLLPLYLAQDSLDAPGNPNSLQALLDGTAPNLEGDVAVSTLIDALLAEIGLADALSDSLSHLAAVPRPDQAGGQARRAKGHWALESRGGPTNAFQLHAEMEMAQWGETFSGKGPLGDTISKGSALVGLVGLVPHAGTKAAAMAVGSATFSITKGAEAAANLLPSRFVSLDFELSPERLPEDSDNTGHWREVMVVAASKGWKLDRAILEALLQFTQVKGGYDSWLNRFGPPQGFREALGAHLYTEAVNWTLQNTAEGSGFVSIPPKQTQPIDITEEPWSFATVSYALMEEGRQGYRLDSSWEGEGRGEVQVGTALGMFGGQHLYTRREVTIEPMRIVIDPTSVSVDPWEIVRFHVTVHGANKGVSVHAANGATAHQPQADGTHLIIYEAPAGEDGLPDTLTVTSTSEGGLLANPTRRRPQATAFIRSKHPHIEIEPRGVCVKTGSKQTFTATVENLDNTQVRWDVDVGSITQAGVYTAPANPGSATITATSVADPSVSASTTIGVGPCNCVWSARVTGQGAASFMGSDIHISVEDGKVTSLAFVSPFDPALGFSSVIAELDNGRGVGSSGSFVGPVQGSHFARGTTQDADTFESIDPIAIEIEKFAQDGERFEVEGTINGTIYWESVNEDGPRNVRDWVGSLEVHFRGSMEYLGIPGGDPENSSLWCNPFK